MKIILIIPLFIFSRLISFSQVQDETKSKPIPGNEMNVESSSAVLYDSLVNYTFTTENDSEFYSKIIYHYNEMPELSDKFTYKWDNANNRWKNNHRSEYSYDSEGRTTMESDYEWNIVTNNSWYGIGKNVYAYDQDGNLVLYETYPDYNITDNTWVGSTKYEAVFGNPGQLLSRTNYFWNTIWNDGAFIGMWSLVSKEEDLYNENGTIDSVIIFGWDSEDSIFFKSEQKVYLYDPSDSLASMTDIRFDMEGNPSNNYKQDFTYDTTSVVMITYHWDHNTNEWLYYSKYEKVRNALGKETLVISYNYDAVAESWKASQKNEYTYDENGNQNTITAYYFDEAGDSWIGLTRTEFLYDDQHRKAKQVNKEWNVETSDWDEALVYETSWDINGEMATNSYYSYRNDYGNMIENVFNEDGIKISYNQYAGNPDEWRLYGRGYYYWTPEVISGTEDPRQSDKITMYPNPVTSKMQIQGLTGKSMLYIFDTLGQLVYSRKVENNEEIDLGQLPAGLYLTRINSSTGIYKGKFVKSL